jgi:hypothetical protein
MGREASSVSWRATANCLLAPSCSSRFRKPAVIVEALRRCSVSVSDSCHPDEAPTRGHRERPQCDGSPARDSKHAEFVDPPEPRHIDGDALSALCGRCAGVAQRVRPDTLGGSGAASDPAHDPAGGMTIGSTANGLDEDRPVAPVTNR